MNLTSELILVESKSARDAQLANTTNDRAEDALSKAKALLHFAMHQGNKIATTEQVAEFYEVPVDTVRTAYSRHKDEFALDGVCELKGKELKALRGIGHDSLKLPDSVTRLMAWNPRGALRLGMLLRDSEVAKAIRTELLNNTDTVAKQSEEIELLKAAIRLEELKGANLDRLNSLATLHGSVTAMALLGQSDKVVEVEKPTIEVIDDKHKAYFKGQTLKQVAEYVKKRYGVRLKDGGAVAKALKQAKKDNLIAHVPRTNLQTYIPQEHLDEVYKVLTEGNRQMLIGE